MSPEVPGEDTIANFVTADGRVLKSIVAKGGKGGSPSQHGPLGRDVTLQDVESGLHVSSLMLSECAQLKDGLLYLLGAGWEHFQFPSSPFEAQWPLVCIMDSGSVEAESVLAFEVTVRDPTGLQVMEAPFSVVCTAHPVSRQNALSGFHSPARARVCGR